MADELLCEVQGCNKTMFQKLNDVRLCTKHYSQMKTHGKILQRTIYDKNEIIIDGDFAYIVLYNKKSEEIARTKIDSKNIKMWFPRKNGS